MLFTYIIVNNIMKNHFDSVIFVNEGIRTLSKVEVFCNKSSWLRLMTFKFFNRKENIMKKLLIILLVVSLALFFAMCIPPIGEPTFDPPAGAVLQGTAITISTTTEGASIYYTTNGDNPTTESTLYSDATKPIINSALTIKAIAVKDSIQSEIATASYTIDNTFVTLIVNIQGNGTVAVTVDGTPATGNSPYTIEGGSDVVLTATPTAPDQFLGWEGDASGATNTYTFENINGNKSVNAYFGNPATPATIYVYLVENIWGGTQSYEVLFDNNDNTIVGNGSAYDYNPNTQDWITDIRVIYSHSEFIIPVTPSSTVDFPVIAKKIDVVGGVYDWIITNPTYPTGWNGTAFTNMPTNQYGANPTYLAGASLTSNGLSAQNDGYNFIPGCEYTITIKDANWSEPHDLIILEKGNKLPTATFYAFQDTTPIINSTNVQDIGYGGSTVAFTLKNTGGSPLNITGISFTNTSDVSVITNPAPITLDCGEKTNLVFDINSTLTDSGTVSITHSATGSPFEFKFKYRLLAPAVVPESFEGTDWNNLTTTNEWILEGNAEPTLSTIQCFDGSQSVRFFQSPADQYAKIGYINTVIDIQAGEVVSFFYKRMSGVNFYSYISIYDDKRLLGTIYGGEADGSWKKWSSPIFTESGEKLIRIEFNHSGWTNMEVYIDYFNVAEPVPLMSVKYNGEEVPFDGSTYAVPNNISVGQEFFFTVECSSNSLVPLNITGFNYASVPEITNSTPLSTGNISIGGNNTIGFTIPAVGTYTSGLITINSNSDIPIWTFKFAANGVTPPSPPTNVNASLSATLGAIDISWTEPAMLPMNGYNVYRATTSSGPYTKANGACVPVGTTTFTDNVGDGTYYYIVKSENVGPVESIASNETTGITISGVGVLIGYGFETGHNLPVDDYWYYIYTQQIYLKSELGNQPSKKIDRIKIKVQEYNEVAWYNPVTIYIGHTTKTQFASSTDWEPLSNLTQVWTGNINVSGLAAGTWYEIIFDTPFNYDNTSNLVVAFDQDYGDFGPNHSCFAGTPGTGRSLYAYSFTDINPTFPTVAESATLVDFFPNMLFILSNQ